MASKDTELKRSAVIGAALGEFVGIDPQTREDAAQLLAHFYRNGHRTAEQLKAAVGPATLQAVFRVVRGAEVLGPGALANSSPTYLSAAF